VDIATVRRALAAFEDEGVEYEVHRGSGRVRCANRGEYRTDEACAPRADAALLKERFGIEDD